MGKKILAVIVGYVVMFVFVFISFSLLYLILGADGAFEEGSYRVTTTWLVVSFILGFVGAVIGGLVCSRIAKSFKTGLVLAGVVFVLGVALAIPALGSYAEVENLNRDGSLSNVEAMQNAAQPDVALILNPLIGGIGVVLGAGLYKRNRPEKRDEELPVREET